MGDLIKDLLVNVSNYYYGIVALLPKLGIALVVVVLMVFIARFVRSFSLNRLISRMDDPLLANFIANLAGTAVIMTALLMALNIVGLGGVAVGLLSTAGLGAFVIGFAFKDIGENFLAGIVLAFKRPFRIGDTVELDGHKGRVQALNLRDTQLKTSDGKDIFIPNSIVVKNSVVNHSIDVFTREEFHITLSYSTDLEKAVAVVQRVLDRYFGILHEEGKQPDVVYGEMSPTTICLVARYWLNTFTTTLPASKIKQHLFDKMQAALKAEDISMPTDPSEVIVEKTVKNKS